MKENSHSYKPETPVYTMENLGFYLRDAVSFPPDVFPDRVAVRKNSPFFRSAFNNLYRGEGTTVPGGGGRFLPKGSMVEHNSFMAANQKGELMVVGEIYEGTPFATETRKNIEDYREYLKKIIEIPVNSRWKTCGTIHSHPDWDLINEICLVLDPFIPRISGRALTWSGGDYNFFLLCAKNAFRHLYVSGLVSGDQLSFMAASKLTLKKLRETDDELSGIAVSKWGLPPYRRFAELGIVLYAGSHSDNHPDRFLLKRLI